MLSVRLKLSGARSENQLQRYPITDFRLRADVGRWLLKWSLRREKSSLFLLSSRLTGIWLTGTRAFKVKEKYREKIQKMKLKYSWNCKLSKLAKERKDKKGGIRWDWGSTGPLLKGDLLQSGAEIPCIVAMFPSSTLGLSCKPLLPFPQTLSLPLTWPKAEAT